MFILKYKQTKTKNKPFQNAQIHIKNVSSQHLNLNVKPVSLTVIANCLEQKMPFFLNMFFI